MRTWRNWYTRSLEETVPQGMQVQVLSSALDRMGSMYTGILAW